jgi:hypothetical protein
MDNLIFNLTLFLGTMTKFFETTLNILGHGEGGGVTNFIFLISIHLNLIIFTIKNIEK